jgi:WD40 repeat protein
MSGQWQTVRVFISSTFRDMHAERDHLVKVVFPALRERLETYRVHLIDIDLRWGVTREQAENAQALALCLQQVDECRPFFLGLLGERHGWVPDAFPTDLLARHGWVKHHAGKSVTDLEMLYGVVAARDASRRAFFYFRNPAALDTIPDDRRADFVESHPEQVRKLRALKDRIRRHAYPLFDGYPARWDAGAYDRPSRSPGRLGGLEDFGRRVQADLWQAIQAELKLPVTPPTETVTEPLAEEQDYHDRFMESRLRVYVGRDEVQRRLLEFADGAATVPCLVSGPSGAGKSAALARFFTDYHRRHPDVLAVPHFIGASPRSTSLRQLLRRLCLVLKSRFGFEDEVPEETVPLRVTFRDFLARVPADSRVLLVIDALNQLDEAEGGQDLQWLPLGLPPQVKVVVSCIADPDRPETVLEAFGRRPHQALALEPLRDEERREIIRAVPSLSAKTLDDSQVDLLLSNLATTNPLFLLVALEELRGFGSYDQLNDRIASLPREGDTVTALFDQVLTRLEEEFDTELVRLVLLLLASARRGLSERELRSLTASLPGADDLFAVLRQLRPYLLRRGSLVDFYHRNLFKAVRARYLAAEEVERTAHACLAEFFHEQDYRLESPEEQRPPLRPSAPQQRPVNVRKVDELLWQRLQAGQADEGANLLLDLAYLEAKSEAGMVFELAGEFTAVTQALPEGNRRRLLELLEEGLRHDIHFIHRHYRDYPQGLFQCLWNRCWWYDCPEAANHYRDGSQVWAEGPPWETPRKDRLSTLLETWRRTRQQQYPRFFWVRMLRPLEMPLRSGDRLVLRGHDRKATSAACFPTKPWLVSGSFDGTVRIWGECDGEEVKRLSSPGGRGRVLSIAVHPNETLIASGEKDTGKIYLWDLETDSIADSFTGQYCDILSVAIDPTGQYLAGVSENRNTQAGELIVWALTTRRKLRRDHFDRPIRCATFSPDGRWLACAVDQNGLYIKSVSSEESYQLRRRRSEKIVNCIAFSPSGDFVATGGSDRVVRVWSLANRSLAREFVRRHEREVTSVAWSRDGRFIVSGSGDQTIRVWVVESGQEQRCFRGHQNEVWSVCFLPHGNEVVSASHDNTARVWDCTRNWNSAAPDGHSSWINDLTFSFDGNSLVTGGKDGKICVWNARTGILRCERSLPRRWISSVTLSADCHSVFAGTNRGYIHRWKFDCDLLDLVVRAHSEYVSSIACSADGKHIATGSWDGSVSRWDANNLSLLQSLSRSRDNATRGKFQVQGVTFSSDGRFLAAGSANSIVHIWDLTSGVGTPLPGVSGKVQDVAFSFDSQRIGVSVKDDRWQQDGFIQLYDARTHARLGTPIPGTGDVAAVVTGSPSFPFRALSQRLETRIDSSKDGKIIGFIPVSFEVIATHPREPIWAATAGKHLYLFCLEEEGRPGQEPGIGQAVEAGGGATTDQGNQAGALAGGNAFEQKR